MIKYSEQRMKQIDAQRLPLNESLTLLRMFTIDEFGEMLMTLPNKNYPHFSALFPEMASEEIQKGWTGSSGITLLRQSVGFMNYVATTFAAATGRAFRDVDVLDFGCGWGRLLRLLAYFNDPQYTHGCDAWDVSLNHSKLCGVEKVVSSLKKSDAYPVTLPYEEDKFDLIYAFSIFTHLSEDSTKMCMNAVYRAIKPDGIAIITVRPAEFWDFNTKIPELERKKLSHTHLQNLVAFYPHGGQRKDSQGHEAVYGDTSIPPEIIENLFHGWKILNIGATFIDSQQIFIALRPLKKRR